MTDSIAIKRTMRENEEKLILINNLELTKFPEEGKLTKLNQEETDNMNSPVSIKGIEFLAKNLPMKKFLGRPGWL